MNVTITLTAANLELLDRIAQEIFGSQERSRSATVALIIREKHAALFGKEATPGAAKKEVGSDELPEQTETEQESP